LEINQREQNDNLKEMNMKLDRGLKGTNRKPLAGTGIAAPAKATTQSASQKAKTDLDGQNGNRTVAIEANIDVGFGNMLYLRGEGQGLSWNQGIPLTCVDSSTWKWSAEAKDPLKFKLLLNDAIWSKGEDMVVAPGQKLQISPTF
jgi:hypothetical protein